jgi:hypothetical protein
MHNSKKNKNIIIYEGMKDLKDLKWDFKEIKNEKQNKIK